MPLTTVLTRPCGGCSSQEEQDTALAVTLALESLDYSDERRNRIEALAEKLTTATIRRHVAAECSEWL